MFPDIAISTLAILPFLFPLTSAAAATAAVTQLSDGKTIEYGMSGLATGLFEWQASGILTQGCTLSTAISGCYGISLTSDPNSQLDTHFPDSPRQRMEFRTNGYPSGSRYSFTWKQYLPTSVTTSTHFFHLMQVFDEVQDGPILTLDAVSNQMSFTDFVGDKCADDCPAVALDSYNGRTTLHSLQITFGPNGQFDYFISDAVTGDEIMEYHTAGQFGTSSTYVKYGTYRATFSGMSTISAAVGDFTQKQL